VIRNLFLVRNNKGQKGASGVQAKSDPKLQRTESEPQAGHAGPRTPEAIKS
jgi:hypothetical protein